jgi:hypothetical protein
MSDAGQNQKQGELAELPWAEGGRNSEIGGDLLEGMEYAEDGAGCGLGNGGMVEVAAEQAAKGVDAGFGPGGEIEESAVFNFAVFAKRLAQEDGRGRSAVGDLRDVHNHIVSYNSNRHNITNTNYMTTSDK